MSSSLGRLLRVPLVIAAVWAILAAAVPMAMTLYQPDFTRSGVNCVRTGVRATAGEPFPAGFCEDLPTVYHLSFTDLYIDSMFRSLSLLLGAAILALVIGTLLGIVAALWRRKAFLSGGIVASATLVAAVPAFFVAYFLQIGVIVCCATATGGMFLPVYGFGYDSHLVLPLLSVSLTAIAYTAQLTATRVQDVLDSDFITVANAKGLRMSWIMAIHVIPHVRPVVLEALSSGLRVSVASLPIIEYLFGWRGIGQLALEAVAVHDATGLVFTAVVLAALFTTLSAVADLSRHRALYRPAQ